MSDPEIIQRLDRIEAAVLVSTSPWLRGDNQAARWSGYKSRKAFRAWARDAGIRPSVDSGMNFWAKRDIERARERSRA